MTSLLEALNELTVPGDLYEVVDEAEKRIRCYACAHRCLIKDGRRGICQVRYNEGGVLRVPHGYVGALQVDPTEKKPFFHLLPGSLALSFGMLGCDLHCSYCFVGDTVVITDRGPLRLEDAFDRAARVEHRPDGDIAYPDDLRTIAASGTWRRVRAVFRHPYRGKLAVVRPYYLPELRCTADHRVYATKDVACEPLPIPAQELTSAHYLVIPRRCVDSLPQIIDAGISIQPRIIGTDEHYLIPLRDVTPVDYEGEVYNMEVEVEHNYLAGFFLVKNCQNWDISQFGRDDRSGRDPLIISEDDLVTLARRRQAQVVASTYNEPLITTEWAVSVFKRARAAGMKTVYVSNGNATPEALEYLRPHLDGYKIDLKSMRDKPYRQLGAVLQHVLDTVQRVHALGLWVEVVTLIVPGFNDSNEELWDAARFLAGVSPDIPWHVTAFHPDYKMRELPRTTIDTLIRAAEIGAEAGLRYVYAGNIPGAVGEWEDTRCPTCQTTLIRRDGFHVMENRLAQSGGTCPSCGTVIPGIWS